MNMHVLPTSVTPATPPEPAPTIASLFHERHRHFTCPIDDDSDAAYERARACEVALMAMPTRTAADLAMKLLVAIGDGGGNDGDPVHDLSASFITEHVRPFVWGISPAEYAEELCASGYRVLAHVANGKLAGTYRLNPEDDAFDFDRMLATESRRPDPNSPHGKAFMTAVGEYCIATGRIC